MKTSRFTLLLTLTMVACAPLKSTRTVISGEASTVGATSDPTKFYEVTSDDTLRVWQDKLLSFQPAGGAAGTYAASGLPGWASLNTSTGIVSGTLRTAAAAGGPFTITRTNGGVTQTYGPYAVELVGDVLKEQQWHLTNLGQKAYAYTAGTSGEDIHLSSTVNGNIYGTGVRVAISDSGTVVAHPDLAPNNLNSENRNYLQTYGGSWLGDPTPSASEPDYAHGTAVAGLTAAKGWNGIGGRGVASEAKFAAFLYVQAQDKLQAAGLSDSALYDQYNGNFDVFNYSWGMPQCALDEKSSTYYSKLQAGVTSQRSNRGSIFVVAGGNDFVADTTDCYPNANSGSDIVLGNVSFSGAQSTPYVINVAAVNASGKSSSYSSPGSALWVSSTGGEYGYSSPITGAPQASKPALVTTDYPGCGNGLKSINRSHNTLDAGAAPNADCRYTATMNGTSGASPIAAGVVALMLQMNPTLTWRDVKYILAKTADQIDPTAAQPKHPESAYDLAGHTYELPWINNHAPTPFHFHDWYGFGRINVDAAVAAANAYAANSLGTFRDTGWISSNSISVSVPDNSATGVTRTLPVGSITTEAVLVKVSITGCISDVGLELTSPLGTTSILMNINSHLRETNMTDHIFLANAFLDEAAAGNWTLKVIDGHASCVPVLTNWQIQVFGH